MHCGCGEAESPSFPPPQAAACLKRKTSSKKTVSLWREKGEKDATSHTPRGSKGQEKQPRGLFVVGLPSTLVCHRGAPDLSLFTQLTETNQASSTHRVPFLSPSRLARSKSGRSSGPRPGTHFPAHPDSPSAHLAARCRTGPRLIKQLYPDP
ncbi:hypothetical protein AOLI_G00103990 [Acnodon oligacanthus]